MMAGVVVVLVAVGLTYNLCFSICPTLGHMVSVIDSKLFYFLNVYCVIQGQHSGDAAYLSREQLKITLHVHHANSEVLMMTSRVISYTMSVCK